MKDKVSITILTLIFVSICHFAFPQQNKEKLFWSSTRKLSIEDFGIKISNDESTASFAQFSIDYRLNGFDFLTKNFNNKVHNYMIPIASWIDTTKNTKQILIYEQTLFDISEVYVRKFRKQLKENRKKIIRGIEFAEELNSKILTEFSKRRIEYNKETSFGENIDKQEFWEARIQKELSELEEFAYEK